MPPRTPAHRLFLLIPVAITILACGSPPIGHGVLLWAPDGGSLESAAVLTVTSESDITDTYTVLADEGELEIERWRVELYATESEARTAAEDYAAAFDGATTLRARATRNALPIRSSPEALSTNTIYRLRENEEIKLIDREPEETDLQGLISYWYEALTSTGERGWVFGYTLEIYDADDPTNVIESGRSNDPLLDLLMNNIWRPVYYVDMIRNGTIDLELFRIEHGLFPDPGTNTFELVLPAHAELFEYERISRVGNRRYIAEGTALTFTFQRRDELSLQYSIDGEQYVIAMQRVEGSIQEYIDAEIERRESVYQTLLDLGPEFESDNYGSLTFADNSRFRWTGFDRLVPAAIPAGAGTTGRVELDLFLADSLEQSFDGALTFLFDGTSSPVSFAYSLEPDGIRLVWVPPDNIDDRLVTGTGTTSLTIFMSSGA